METGYFLIGVVSTRTAKGWWARRANRGGSGTVTRRADAVRQTDAEDYLKLRSRMARKVASSAGESDVRLSAVEPERLSRAGPTSP